MYGVAGPSNKRLTGLEGRRECPGGVERRCRGVPGQGCLPKQYTTGKQLDWHATQVSTMNTEGGTIAQVALPR